MTEEVFAQAVEAYGDTLFRVAYSYLKNPSDAQDVMQETLLKFYLEQKPFDSEEHQRRWLIRVAVNESKKLLRSAWRRRSVPMEEETAVAFDTLAQRELFEQVMALPPRYRLSVYLYYYESFSVREIAQVMGANPSTVQTWLMRARGLLREALQEA